VFDLWMDEVMLIFVEGSLLFEVDVEKVFAFFMVLV